MLSALRRGRSRPADASLQPSGRESAPAARLPLCWLTRSKAPAEKAEFCKQNQALEQRLESSELSACSAGASVPSRGLAPRPASAASVQRQPARGGATTHTKSRVLHLASYHSFALPRPFYLATLRLVSTLPLRAVGHADDCAHCASILHDGSRSSTDRVGAAAATSSTLYSSPLLPAIKQRRPTMHVLQTGRVTCMRRADAAVALVHGSSTLQVTHQSGACAAHRDSSAGEHWAATAGGAGLEAIFCSLPSCISVAFC